jgi:hypothetical protein
MSRNTLSETNPAIEKLKGALDPARRQVISHPLYGNLTTKAAVVRFMEHHVFAV